ncbi:6-carboxytetrahydropterin synthase [Brevibacillus humidisoli]|uniref:6-pyruvoyl trahydropterin synthase family protein n=1 Tax=Brevibacillus humidisoli TaxID=2895522 RepID=UPI001E3C7195|nr:6-carboxytetrahydropterin synthase [Brevibacillus humidisoli]UFJ42467.1 6-carboxytetrahydropterin synthase [Brevibacillus humidisoli]
MPMVRICKTVEFSAAHRLYQPTMSPQENDRCYGKCTVDHGHNYRLVVCLEGEVDKQSGMLLNLSQVKETVQHVIVDKLDHQHLNQVPELAGVVPTVENLVVWIWEELEKRFGQGLLKEVILYETDYTYASYSG